MATVPVRSQPLHNFSLPFLKWGKNQMNNQRCRKSSVDNSSQEFPPLDHHHHRSSSSSSPSSAGASSETESDRDIELENRKIHPIVSSSTRTTTTTTTTVIKHHHHRLPDDFLMKKNHHPTMLESEAAAGGGAEEGGTGGGGGEESATKPWNLRPRRVVFKAATIEIEGSSRGGEMLQQEKPSENLPKSLRLRGVSAEGGGGGQNVEKKKKEKQKFWISLSREEIEEDFFIMTGSKPSRRPKKRPRTIQKQVDNVFPGLWLAGITADSYIVPDVPAKR